MRRYPSLIKPFVQPSKRKSPSYEALDKQVENELPIDLLASGKNKECN